MSHSDRLQAAGIDPDTNAGMSRLTHLKRQFAGFVLLHRCGAWLYAVGGVNGDAAIVRRAIGRPATEERVEAVPDADGRLLVRKLTDSGHRVLVLQAKE